MKALFVISFSALASVGIFYLVSTSNARFIYKAVANLYFHYALLSSVRCKFDDTDIKKWSMSAILRYHQISYRATGHEYECYPMDYRAVERVQNSYMDELNSKLYRKNRNFFFTKFLGSLVIGNSLITSSVCNTFNHMPKPLINSWEFWLGFHGFLLYATGFYLMAHMSNCMVVNEYVVKHHFLKEDEKIEKAFLKSEEAKAKNGQEAEANQERN